MSVNVVDNNITVTAIQEVEVANEVVTNTVVNEYPNTISVKSNEFAVVGDGLFATTKEEVPGWMRELVGDLARNATIGAYNAMTGFNYNLYNAMIALQVAENKYQQAINTRITDQEAFVQAVETLNSTVQNSESEIVEIKQTYATKDFATTTAAQTLEASLNGGAIKSSLGQLASTMTNQYGTMAQRMDVLESTFEDLELGVEGYANATNTLETYVGLTEGVPDGTGLIAKVEILEKQNDGIIETITGTYDVILRAAEPDFSELVTTAEPYASWLAAEVSGGIDVRLSHIGDVYIKYQDTASGTKEYVGSYKFIRTIVDTTTPHSTDSAGFTWAVIQDQAAEMAYTAALNAHDLADGKRRVFVGLGATTTPIPPYDVGDLWLVDAERVVNGTLRKVGDLLRTIESKGAGATYEQNDWVLASSYADAVAAEAQALETWKTNVYDVFVGEIQEQVDGKAESYYQEGMPHIEGANVEYAKWVGDLWKKPSNNDEYIYQLVGTEYKWVKTDVPDIVYDTIDGKKSIFTGNAVPTAIGVNDMWITGDTPVSPYIAKSIYVWNGTAWLIPVRYTDDQYAKDIENGTRQIDLSQHIDSLGWSSSISTLFSDVNTINTDLTQKALEIANLDNIISLEEAARIQAILDEETARIADIALRVAEDARLDGKITSEEQNRIDAVNELDYAYKEYGRIIALALADGVLTPEEQLAITAAQTAVNAAKQRLLDIENNVSTLFSDISAINTTTASQALEIANLDSAISAEESSRIQAILAEETARIQAINARIAEEALLDGKITAEEQNRINSINAVEVAYKEYSRVITLALADGVLTPEEQALITAAAAEVQAAKDRLLEIETNANNYSDSILDNFLVSTYSKDLLNIGNQIDGVAVTYFQNDAPYSVTVGTSANSGDVWYDTNAIAPTAYKFVYKVLNSDGITVISPSVWEPITNTFVLSSLEAASKTKASADRSIKNYITTPITPYYEGDTWMQGSTGDIYVCNNPREIGAFVQSDWVIASKYTDDTAVNNILNGTTSIANAKIGTVDIGTYVTSAVSVGTDNMVHVYSGNQNQKPTTAELGDLYVETNSVTAVVTTYRWNGASWAEIEGASNVKALADLSDGKRTIYTTANIPTDADAAGDLTVKVNDLWIPPVTVGSYRAKEIYICTSVNPITFALATDYYALINNVQAQVDGKVDTYYQATVPYSNQVNVGKDVRAGDYWYCTANTGSYIKGNIYKYLETANGSNYNYTWTLTADVTKSAFDAIDGKKAVYGGSAVPTAVNYPGLAVNDLWIPSADNGSYLKGEVYQYNGTAWVTATKYTEDLDDFVDNVYTPVVVSLQSQVDSKIENWYTVSTADPKTAWTTTAERTKHNGDLWYQTDTKKSYYYRSNTHSWNVLEDSTALAALTAASNAQATADGIVVSYYAVEQSTAPATSKLWLCTNTAGSYVSGVLYEYVVVVTPPSQGWVPVDVKPGDTLTAVVTEAGANNFGDSKVYIRQTNNWVTETGAGMVASSKAVTDLKAYLEVDGQSLGGTSTVQNYVETKAGAEGKRVESLWEYGSTIRINNVPYTSNFGLKSTGTDSEFLVTADKFKLMTAIGGTKSSYSPFSVNGTDGTITFNGKVSFNSVTNVPNYVLPAEVANAINTNTTTIDGGKITTGSITALGTVTTGLLQSVSNVNTYVNLNATGSSNFIKCNESFSVTANGTVYMNNAVIAEEVTIRGGLSELVYRYVEGNEWKLGGNISASNVYIVAGGMVTGSSYPFSVVGGKQYNIHTDYAEWLYNLDWGYWVASQNGSPVNSAMLFTCYVSGLAEGDKQLSASLVRMSDIQSHFLDTVGVPDNALTVDHRVPTPFASKVVTGTALGATLTVTWRVIFGSYTTLSSRYKQWQWDSTYLLPSSSDVPAMWKVASGRPATTSRDSNGVVGYWDFAGVDHRIRVSRVG